MKVKTSVKSGGWNGNGSGDNLVQGQTNLVVRAIGLYGNGQDPMQQVLDMKDAAAASGSTDAGGT